MNSLGTEPPLIFETNSKPSPGFGAMSM